MNLQTRGRGQKSQNLCGRHESLASLEADGALRAAVEARPHVEPAGARLHHQTAVVSGRYELDLRMGGRSRHLVTTNMRPGHKHGKGEHRPRGRHRRRQQRHWRRRWQQDQVSEARQRRNQTRSTIGKCTALKPT